MAKRIYEHYDDLVKGRITRREFLRRAATAGAATPLILGYLNAPDAAARPASPHFSLTRAMAQGAPLQPPDASVDTSDPLIFRGWAYAVETVQDNANRFNQQYKENVDYQTVTGDYIAIMENFHIANQPLDMAYANPATLFRWQVPGWVVDYERWWDVADARGEMYDGVRESLSIGGKLYGLPYFVSIRGTLMANNAILAKAGITPEQYPKTWDELYAQARQLKTDGVTEGPPLLPHLFGGGTWYGISWAYLFECLNRGAVLFGENNEPVFDEQTLAVLQNWRQLLEEGVIPDGVFTMGETDYIDAFAKGTYAYSPQQVYDLKVFNDPNKSQVAGQVAAVPVNGQPWGLIDEGIYVIANRNQDEARLRRDYQLAGFFGYRDQSDQLFVAKRWAMENALNSGYKEVLDDPEVIAAYNEWLPDPAMLDAVKGLVDAGQFPRVWQTFWWEEYNAFATTELPKAVLGDRTVEEVHADLKKKAEDLVAQYG